MHSISKRGVDTPFCDWLTVTVPEGESHAMGEALGPLILSAGAVPQVWGYAIGSHRASVAVKRRHQVVIWSFSGGAVEALRDADQWGPVLAEIGAFPHRVTRLDAAYDTEEDAPLVLPEVEKRGHHGELRISRKAVAPDRVRWQRSLGPCGRVTGTVYAGKRGKVSALARVYDKRAHVADTLGEDPGVPWTRYELELSIPGIALADAWAPEALFWAYGAELVRRPVPDHVHSWEAHGAGYVLPPRRERSLREQLEARVERSDELPALRGMAEAMGEGGRMALRRLVLERLGLPA